MIYHKPNIIISKCINFENCRFNWDKVNDIYIDKLSKYVNFITVCPEVAIWLGTPRMPIRIYRDKNNNLKLYQSWKKIDITKKMNNFSKIFLEKQKNIDWFILKNRSPSCWIADVKIYNKIDSNVSTERNWVWLFTQNINDIFPLIPKEDEWRLKNFILREEFLTKIFSLAEFREIKKENKISKLIDFQAKNKYLFMAFSVKLQKDLWQIIANFNKTNLEEIFNDYYKNLLNLFNIKINIWKKINAFTHIFWYFKDTCSKEEKEFFLESIEVYREWRIPTSSIINILKVWALRDKKEYILKQSILNPYPKELIELSDSWKNLYL